MGKPQDELAKNVFFVLLFSTRYFFFGVRLPPCLARWAYTVVGCRGFRFRRTPDTVQTRGRIEPIIEVAPCDQTVSD